MTMRAVRINASTFPIEPDEQHVLEQAGIELVGIEGQEPEDILAAARDCDALLVVSSWVPASVITHLTQCRTIARMGAGTDKIDVEMATQCGIVVSNVPDFCLGEQADHTMALLLSFARRLPYMQEAFAQRQLEGAQSPGRSPHRGPDAGPDRIWCQRAGSGTQGGGFQPQAAGLDTVTGELRR